MLLKIIAATTLFFVFSLFVLWMVMQRVLRAVKASAAIGPVAPVSPARIIADRQLVAYNARDIDALIALFADDAVLIDLPSGAVTAQGKAAIRALHEDRFANPDLKATVLQKTDIGAFAIDRETVTGVPGGPVEVLAIYEVQGDLIRSVRLIRQAN